MNLSTTIRRQGARLYPVGAPGDPGERATDALCGCGSPLWATATGTEARCRGCGHREPWHPAPAADTTDTLVMLGELAAALAVIAEQGRVASIVAAAEAVRSSASVLIGALGPHAAAGHVLTEPEATAAADAYRAALAPPVRR